MVQLYFEPQHLQSVTFVCDTFRPWPGTKATTVKFHSSTY